MFFDDHPLFLETSETAASVARLNLRHQAIIEANQDILEGARVLDLASHDGRWSFAALKAGAAHVTGVEARAELVDNADKTFAHYGIDPSRYEFVAGDMFDVLDTKRFDVDVVLCLGFVYHTLRYPELFHGMVRNDPKHCVIDTKVTKSDEPVVSLLTNRTNVQSNAAEEKYASNGKVIAGWPSVPALEMMLDVYGMDVEDRFDWRSLSARNKGETPRIGDYRRGNRVTLRCRVRSGLVGARGA